MSEGRADRRPTEEDVWFRAAPLLAAIAKRVAEEDAAGEAAEQAKARRSRT